MSQELKTSLLVALLKRGEMKEALVFTRTKHRANRLAEQLAQAEDQRRAHPRQPLAGAAHRRARRLQERALPRARRHRHRGARHRRRGARPRRQLRRAARARGLHPPRRPHRARRGDRRRVHVRRAERGSRPRGDRAAIGKRLPRVTVPDFDYTARATERFEVPIADRIAEIRKRKSEERARARVNAERRAGHGTGGRPAGGGHARPAGASRPGGQPGGGGRPSGGGGGRPGGGGPAGARGGSFGPRRPGGSPSGPRRSGNR